MLRLLQESCSSNLSQVATYGSSASSLESAECVPAASGDVFTLSESAADIAPEHEMDIDTLETLFASLDDSDLGGHIPSPISHTFLTMDATSAEVPLPSTTLAPGAGLSADLAPQKRRASSSSEDLESTGAFSPCSSKPTYQIRSPSASSSEGSDSNEYRASRSRQRYRASAKPNPSWAYQKDLKARAKSSAFQPNDLRLNQFRFKITSEDAYAEFDDQDIRRVRCSSCAAWVMMRQLYDIRRWKDHRRSAKCQVRQQHGLVNKSIRGFFTKEVVNALADVSPACTSPISNKVHCPGLRREAYVKVARFIKRTLAPGGGAPSRPEIAKLIFGPNVVYSQLSNDDKKQILRRENHLYQWRIVRSAGSVYSTKCLEMVPAKSSGQCPRPCTKCLDLFALKSFKVALQRKEAPEDRMKYTPFSWRDSAVSDIYLKVKGVRELVENVIL